MSVGFEGGTAIHSVSYSAYQYSTTNTTANTTPATPSTNQRGPTQYGHHGHTLPPLSVPADVLSEDVPLRQTRHRHHRIITEQGHPHPHPEELTLIEERTEKSSTKQTVASNTISAVNSRTTASTRLMNDERMKRRKYTSGDQSAADEGHGYGRVLWTEWSRMSRNRFCCGGRLMMGSDFKFFIGTNVLILAPTVLLCIHVLPRIDVLDDDGDGGTLSNLWWIGMAVLLLSTLYALHCAAFTDPGYLPRGKEPDPPPHQQLKPNGSKFCGTCKIWRPPRAKHCRC